MKFLDLHNKLLSKEVEMEKGLCATAQWILNERRIFLLDCCAQDWMNENSNSDQIYVDIPYRYIDSDVRQNILLLLACYCNEY